MKVLNERFLKSTHTPVLVEKRERYSRLSVCSGLRESASCIHLHACFSGRGSDNQTTTYKDRSKIVLQSFYGHQNHADLICIEGDTPPFTGPVGTFR